MSDSSTRNVMIYMPLTMPSGFHVILWLPAVASAEMTVITLPLMDVITNSTLLAASFTIYGIVSSLLNGEG